MIANGFPKGRLLGAKRPPFAMQKTAFWKVKGCLLENRMKATVNKRPFFNKKTVV